MATFTYFPLPRGPLADGPGVQGGWRITSYFGGRLDPITGRPGNHGGEDLAGPGIDGTPFYAVGDGYVSQGWDYSGGGNWTTLYLDGGARVGYGHAKSFAPGVNGTRVAAGTVLGYIDSTGHSSGSHLHFAYDSEDANTFYDDPFDVLEESQGRIVGASTDTTVPPPPGGFSMSEYTEIMAAVDRLERAIGTNLQFDKDAHAEQGKWEQDTRLVAIDGTAAKLAGPITEAGWSSRPYAFRIDGKDDVWMLVPGDGPAGLVRSHIHGDDNEHAFLNTVLLNPHVVVLPAEAEAMLDARFPIAHI